MLAPTEERHHYRTIWLSDIHLGTPGCQAYYLLDFLRTHKANTLYLVGDILDGWQLKKGWYWPRRTTTSCRKCCVPRARVRKSSISPATTTSTCASSSGCNWAGSRSPRTPFT